MIEQTSGKQGGELQGKAHSECDENGCGIKATINGDKTVWLQGKELIVNADAAQDPEVITVTGTKKQIASAINSDKGFGVEIEPGAKVERTGEVKSDNSQLNKNHINDTYKDGGEIPKESEINKMSVAQRKAFYNSKEGKALDKETYSKWKSLVNMSKGEIERFYNSKEGKEAGLSASEAKSEGIDSGRESARWIMKMKDIPYTDWTDNMWRWAKKQTNFISRMSANKGSLYDENGNKTRKHTSLLIWGHNPEKFESGGEVSDLENSEKNNIFIKNNEDDRTSGKNSGTEISNRSTQDSFGTDNSKHNGIEKARLYIRGCSETAKKEQSVGSKDSQSKCALKYAKENGIWINNVSVLGRPTAGGGNENTLYVDEKSGVIYKSNNLYNYKFNINLFFEGIEAHNDIFVANKYELVGFTGVENPGRTPYVEPVIKQDYIFNSEKATQEEIDKYMLSLGFSKINDSTFSDNKYTVSDLHPRNVLKDSKGMINVIDAIVRVNKKESFEQGGEIPNTGQPMQEKIIFPDKFNFEWYNDFYKKVNNGHVLVDDFKEAFKFITGKKEEIISLLDGFTKDKLLHMVGGMTAYRLKSEKKDRVVKGVYSDMLGVFQLGTLSWSHTESFEQALERKIQTTTQEDLQKHADEVSKQREERAVQVATFKKAIENPETVAEFKIFIEKKGIGALTPDQKRIYDSLVSENVLEKREKDLVQRAEISKVDGVSTEMKLIETIHTRDNYPLYVVQLGDRVEKETYNELNKKAKQLGGWYSSFRGKGAVAGFQFKEKAQAEKFMSLKEENVSNLDKIEERIEKKEEKRADKLRANAESLIEKANEELNRERLTNTYKRATQATHSEDRAREQKRIGETMINIADAIDNGSAKYLNNISAKTHIELLDNLVRRAKRDELNTKYPDEYERRRHDGEPATIETIDFLKVGLYPNVWTEHLQSLVNKAEVMKNDDAELAKGTEVEKEHLDTLEKVAEGELTPIEATIEIAQNHIDESPVYYEELEKMEEKINTPQMEISTPEENLVMGSASIPETKKEEMKQTNLGSDDWSKIPLANKYVTKVISKAYTYDPYDKVFQRIMEPFVSTDSLRPLMCGVNFSDIGIAATDAHKLVYLNHVSEKYNGTYCTTPKCIKIVGESDDDKISGNYPRFESVIPNSCDFVYDVDLLAIKTYCETIIRSGYINKTTYQVLFTFDDLTIMGANAKFISECCESFLTMGYRNVKVGVNGVNKGLIFVADPSFDGTYSPVGKADMMLIMPVMVRDSGSDKFDFETMQGDKDWEKLVNVAYDLERDEVVTKGGEVFHKIDISLTKDKVKDTGEVSAKDIQTASQFIKLGNSIPILDYVKIQNSEMTVSNLEVSYTVAGINLPDGMYSIRGNSLFIEKYDIDDYVKLPTSNNPVGDVNRQELMYHFEKCLNFVSNDELRPALGSVHLYKNGGGDLIIEATDAHGLYRQKIEKFNIDGEFDVMISMPKLVYRVLNSFECDDVEIFMTDRTLRLACGDGNIYDRVVDGKFPDTARVYPTSFDKKITISNNELKRIESEIKAEAKKANIKANIVTAHFSFADSTGTYSIAYNETSYSPNHVTKYHVLRSGEIEYSMVTGEFEGQSTGTLIMPVMGIASGETTAIQLPQLKKITDLGYKQVEMGISEPNKAILILNQSKIAGTVVTKNQAVTISRKKEEAEAERIEAENQARIAAEEKAKLPKHYQSMEGIDVGQDYNHTLYGMIRVTDIIENKAGGKIPYFVEFELDWQGIAENASAGLGIETQGIEGFQKSIIKDRQLSDLTGKYLHVYCLGEIDPEISQISNVTVSAPTEVSRSLFFQDNEGKIVATLPLSKLNDVFAGSEIEYVNSKSEDCVIVISNEMRVDPIEPEEDEAGAMRATVEGLELIIGDAKGKEKKAMQATIDGLKILLEDMPVKDKEVIVEGHTGGGEKGGFLLWDFDKDSNMSASRNGITFTIVAIKDGSTYKLLANGKKINQSKNVADLRKIAEKYQPIQQSEPTEKIKMKHVLIHWAEGDTSKYDKFPKKYKSYEAAHKAVIPVFNDYLKDGGGGYNKVKFTILFDDGEEYGGRLDVSDREDNPTTSNNVFGQHIVEWFQYRLSQAENKDEFRKELNDYFNKYDFGISPTFEHGGEIPSGSGRDYSEEQFKNGGEIKSNILGHTKSGKPVYDVNYKRPVGGLSGLHAEFEERYPDFTKEDHLDAQAIHSKEQEKYGNIWQKEYDSLTPDEYNDKSNPKAVASDIARNNASDQQEKHGKLGQWHYEKAHPERFEGGGEIPTGNESDSEEDVSTWSNSEIAYYLGIKTSEVKSDREGAEDQVKEMIKASKEGMFKEGGEIPDGEWTSAADKHRKSVVGKTKEERIELLKKSIPDSGWSSKKITPEMGVVKIHSRIFELEPELVSEIFNAHKKSEKKEIDSKERVTTLFISAKNPLSNQLKKITGDSYNSGDFEDLQGGSPNAGYKNIIKHRATGKLFTTLNQDDLDKLGYPEPKHKLEESISIIDAPKSQANNYEVVGHERWNPEYGWETVIKNDDEKVTMFENLLEPSSN